MQIGGKIKTLKPTKPEVVVQKLGLNEYLKFVADGDALLLTWVGDPNAATKFDSKYSAKSRVRDIEDVGMVGYKTLEG